MIMDTVSKPIGVAADAGQPATFIVVCENGAVYGTANGGRLWRELDAIPSSQKAKAS